VLTPAEVLDPTTWPAIDLVAGLGGPIAATLPDATGALADLRREGHLNQPGVLPGAVTGRLIDAIDALARRDIPPVFLWMHDAPWQVFQAFGPLLAAVLGADYRVLPEIWTWFVPPADDAGGWRPHRASRTG
jgi:hypothetical protein